MKRFTYLKLGVVAALTVTLAACGGGGGSGGSGGGTALDRDGDGIPNTADAFPDDATRFASFATVTLENLTGGQFGTAVAINDAGRAVGFSGNNADEVKAVTWDIDPVAGTAGNPTILNPLAGNLYSSAYGINDGGVVVGESNDGANVVAVTWAANGTTASPLSLAGFGAPAAAYGIDPSGRIVGEATDGTGNVRGVVWASGSADPVSLGLLPGGTTSSAYFIGDTGIIVGEADNAAGETRAVAWSLTPLGAVFGPVDLGTPSASFSASTAFAVDGAGRVVGESETVGGEIHATLWTLDPATLVPIAVADLGAAGSNSGAYAIHQERIVGYDGRGGSSIASILDTRNTGLVSALLSSGGTGAAYGMNGGQVTVGLAGDRGFAAIPR